LAVGMGKGDVLKNVPGIVLCGLIVAVAALFAYPLSISDVLVVEVYPNGTWSFSMISDYTVGVTFLIVRDNSTIYCVKYGVEEFFKVAGVPFSGNRAVLYYLRMDGSNSSIVLDFVRRGDVMRASVRTFNLDLFTKIVCIELFIIDAILIVYWAFKSEDDEHGASG